MRRWHFSLPSNSGIVWYFTLLQMEDSEREGGVATLFPVWPWFWGSGWPIYALSLWQGKLLGLFECDQSAGTMLQVGRSEFYRTAINPRDIDYILFCKNGTPSHTFFPLRSTKDVGLFCESEGYKSSGAMLPICIYKGWWKRSARALCSLRFAKKDQDTECIP